MLGIEQLSVYHVQKYFNNSTHLPWDCLPHPHTHPNQISFSFPLGCVVVQFSADEGGRLPLLGAVYLSAPLSLADLIAGITFIVKRSEVSTKATK